MVRKLRPWALGATLVITILTAVFPESAIVQAVAQVITQFITE